MTTSPWRHQLTNMVAMIVTAALIVSCLVNTVAADGHSDEVHDDAPAAPPPPVPAPARRPAAAPAPRPAAISPPTIAPVPRPPAVATSTTAATPRPTAAPAPSPAPRRLVGRNRQKQVLRGNLCDTVHHRNYDSILLNFHILIHEGSKN